MIMFLHRLICLSVGISLVAANVEKAIFLGPEPINIPQSGPSLASLHINALTPDDFKIRTHVGAVFPTADLTRGAETWLMLGNLTEGQRYEVRTCWLATQPTALYLETYELPYVFETPALVTSLYNYSMSRQPSPEDAPGASVATSPWNPDREVQSSILFLRISAAADYFTVNKTLMQDPEPVLVDIILDPFIWNVLPRTLAPTVVYIVFVAVGSWVLATRIVVPFLTRLIAEGADEKDGGQREDKKTQ